MGLNTQNKIEQTMEEYKSKFDSHKNEFDNHKQDNATSSSLGHVKAKTDGDGLLILPQSEIYAWEKIGEMILNDNALSASFENISSEFKYLKLVGTKLNSSSGSNASLIFKFNDSIGTVYKLAGEYGTSSNWDSYNMTSGVIGSYSFLNNVSSWFEMMILQENGIKNKHIHLYGVGVDRFQGGGFWHDENAGTINKIELASNNATHILKVGSTFELWGAK